MRILIALICASGVIGRANDYELLHRVEFEIPTQMEIDATLKPNIRITTENIDRDVEAMYIEGYGVIDALTTSGPAQDARRTLDRAKKIGAKFVVVSQKYRNTISRGSPPTLPMDQANFISGAASFYGSAGSGTGNYSGTANTYGNETSYTPDRVARFDQKAVFFAPLRRTGLGILTSVLTDPEGHAPGSPKGLFIRAVRRGSPAYQADIIAGDILRELNGKTADDPEVPRSAILQAAVNHLILTRAGKTFETNIFLPVDW